MRHRENKRLNFLYHSSNPSFSCRQALTLVVYGARDEPTDSACHIVKPADTFSAIFIFFRTT